jgi:hypothetical protein
MGGKMQQRTRCRFLLVALGCVPCTASGQAFAAGAAYQVDTVEISEVGACKVETWASFADNKDRVVAMSPACSLPFVRPLELSVQANYSWANADAEASTTLTPKLKVNLLESAIGVPGFAVSGTTTQDLGANQNTAVALNGISTIRLSNVVRVNANVGWLWDRSNDQHFLTYGLGMDWRTPDNVWTVTAEVFGQTGAADMGSLTKPRFQTGLRWRPIDRWNVDLIYGRNITGENANWVTVATIIRFPPK